MSKQTTQPNLMACVPRAIESYWDDAWAPRLTFLA